MAQTKLREGQTVGTAANAIINGDCSVNQRVTAYTLVKDAYCWDSSDLYGPDRFEGMATGTLVSAGTFGQTTSANCGVSGTAFKFAGVTLTGTGILYLRYRMEAKDAKKFKNQTASFKCKAYQDTGGAIDHTIYIRKADVANVFSAVTAISNSGAVSIPNITETALPYAAIAMGDCSNGIEIEIKIAAGAITTKNFEIAECKFEIGATSTNFEFIDFSEELSSSKRYYRKTYSYSIAPASASTASLPGGSGNAAAATAGYLSYTYNFDDMRAPPTIVTYDTLGASGKMNRSTLGAATATGNNSAQAQADSKGVLIYSQTGASHTYCESHLTLAAEL